MEHIKQFSCHIFGVIFLYTENKIEFNYLEGPTPGCCESAFKFHITRTLQIVVNGSNGAKYRKENDVYVYNEI